VRAVIYARVSTDEQATNYSLPTQLAACRDYAASHDMIVAGEFSDDYTGTVPIERRPEGSKAYELLQSDSADAIIVYRADRMGRPAAEGDEWDIPPLIRSLSQLGKEIHTVNRGKIGTSFADLLLAMMDFKTAGDERRAIMERTSRGKTAALRSGRLLVAWTPYGYKINDRRDALEVVDEEAAIVREVFVWYTRGNNGDGPLSMWEIARRLSARHVPTHMDKLGYKRRSHEAGVWSPNAVSRLLAQTAYAGFYRTVFSGVEYDVPVPFIIAREVYEQAQVMREQNARFARRNTKRFYLVSGMIHCGCGCNLSYTGSTKRDRAWYVSLGKTALMYAPGRCVGISVPAAEVEAAAVDYIKRATQSEYFDACLMELARNSNAVDERRAELARITSEIERCNTEAARLVDLVVSGDLVTDALAAKSKALDTRHVELIAQRDIIETEINRLALSVDDMQRYQQMRSDIALGLEVATREQMRAILRVCGLAIIVKDGAIIIAARAFDFIPPSESIQVRQNVRKRKAAH